MGHTLHYFGASLVAQLVKNLPAMWETWVQSLGWENPLEKGNRASPRRRRDDVAPGMIDM